jgi:hypothetical protein
VLYVLIQEFAERRKPLSAVEPAPEPAQ